MQYAGYELKGHLTNWETGLLRNPQNGIMTCWRISSWGRGYMC